MKTLGIETSCDETAIAVYDSKNGLEIVKILQTAQDSLENT